jgi:ABC-type phosphate/phosphonate transport system substrate-binding protein
VFLLAFILTLDVDLMMNIKSFNSMTCIIIRRARRLVAGLLALLAVAPGLASAAEYNLAIQPILPPTQTREAYQPLADYLGKVTGYKIKLVTSINFITYWETMRKQPYDLILDAAHFTSYRVNKMSYTPLAKIQDVVSYTLVTGEGSLIIDPDELIGKKVATIGSPGLGAVRLIEMYPNPLRQPVIVEVNNSIDSIKKVLDKKADGAIVPTPLVGAYPALVSVMTTDQVPHIALSAAPSVEPAAQAAITKALLEAGNTPDGQAMLQAINFPGFEAVTPATYRGYSALLEGVWGY